jgi:hypothetical protein
MQLPPECFGDPLSRSNEIRKLTIPSPGMSPYRVVWSLLALSLIVSVSQAKLAWPARDADNCHSRTSPFVGLSSIGTLSSVALGKCNFINALPPVMDANGVIYMVVEIPEENQNPLNTRHLMAVKDGSVLWSVQPNFYNNSVFDNQMSALSLSPTGEYLYYTEHLLILKLDTGTGTVHWDLDVDPKFGDFKSITVTEHLLVVATDRVLMGLLPNASTSWLLFDVSPTFVGINPQASTVLVANHTSLSGISTQDGTILWTYTIPDLSPTFGYTAIMGDHSAYLLQPQDQTGTLMLWQYDIVEGKQAKQIPLSGTISSCRDAPYQVALHSASQRLAFSCTTKAAATVQLFILDLSAATVMVVNDAMVIERYENILFDAKGYLYVQGQQSGSPASALMRFDRIAPYHTPTTTISLPSPTGSLLSAGMIIGSDSFLYTFPDSCIVMTVQ